MPLTFVFATLGILLVSYALIRLTAYFNHAGSVYALSGATLGPRAGFFPGWALLGTYLAFTAGSSAEVGLIGCQAFFEVTGIWPNAEWLIITLVAAALNWSLADLDRHPHEGQPLQMGRIRSRPFTRTSRIGVSQTRPVSQKMSDRPMHCASHTR